MSNWSEIDKEIIKSDVNKLFFDDDFKNSSEQASPKDSNNSDGDISSKLKEIDRLPDSNEYIQCLGVYSNFMRFNL